MTLSDRAKAEIETDLLSLRRLYDLTDNQVSLVREMLTGMYYIGIVEGHTEGCNDSSKIIERIFNNGK